MMPENLHWFNVPKDASEIKCPKCLEWSSVSQWSDCEPPCDVCGEHAGVTCGRCNGWFDHVWDAEEMFEVRRRNE